MTALVLTAHSRAEEAGYLALADINAMATARGIDYRIVGGQMVSLHVAAAAVPEPTFRQTLDTDLGIEPTVAADPALVAGLRELGYDNPDTANRFVRTFEDRKLIIDLLAPSYGKRMRTNRRHGDLTLDEIPGQALQLSVRMIDGRIIELATVVPDPQSALCVKALGWASRQEAKDAVDVWRLLRVYRARVPAPPEWRATGVQGDATKVLRADFVTPAGAGVKAATPAAVEQAEIRALALHALSRTPFA